MDIVTENTEHPICPHCGAEYPDAWEFDLEDGEDVEVKCEVCKKTFLIEAEITVCYNTRKS